MWFCSHHTIQLRLKEVEGERDKVSQQCKTLEAGVSERERRAAGLSQRLSEAEERLTNLQQQLLSSEQQRNDVTSKLKVLYI